MISRQQVTTQSEDDRQKSAEVCKPLPSRAVVARTRRCIDSASLFTGTREVDIAHGDDVYHLRVTRNNKLILTK